MLFRSNGLSEASKAQLVGKTGEEIVDADIAAQLKGKENEGFNDK